MKIESFRINLAVADSVSKQMLATAMSAALEKICFGVEITGIGNEKTPGVPRQKRKYTRRSTPVAESGAEQRIKNADGTTTIRRGNIPAGGNACATTGAAPRPTTATCATRTRA